MSEEQITSDGTYASNQSFVEFSLSLSSLHCYFPFFHPCELAFSHMKLKRFVLICMSSFVLISSKISEKNNKLLCNEI